MGRIITHFIDDPKFEKQEDGERMLTCPSCRGDFIYRNRYTHAEVFFEKKKLSVPNV